MRVQSLGLEGALEEGVATHSNILAWRNPWTEAPHRLLSIQSQRVEYDWSNLVCTQRTASPPWACKVNQHCFPCLITIILLCLKKKMQTQWIIKSSLLEDPLIEPPTALPSIRPWESWRIWGNLIVLRPRKEAKTEEKFPKDGVTASKASQGTFLRQMRCGHRWFSYKTTRKADKGP